MPTQRDYAIVPMNENVPDRQKNAFPSTTKTLSAHPLSGHATLGCPSLRSYSAASALASGYLKADSFALFPPGVTGNTWFYDVDGYSLEPHRHLKTVRG